MVHRAACAAKKINKLEASKKESGNIIVNLVKKLRSLNESIVWLENAENASKEKEKFKFSKCDYETYNKKGLKIHTRRNHTNFETVKFPNLVIFVKKNLKMIKK